MGSNFLDAVALAMPGKARYTFASSKLEKQEPRHGPQTPRIRIEGSSFFIPSRKIL